MEIQTIGFIPPVEGVEGDFFNTFRLGGTLYNALKEGQKVLLLNTKTGIVFGKAKVIGLYMGELKAMCDEHAAHNHREVAGQNGTDGKSSERLLSYIRKLYGPHIAKDNKRCTVIYLKRLE